MAPTLSRGAALRRRCSREEAEAARNLAEPENDVAFRVDHIGNGRGTSLTRAVQKHHGEV